MSRRSTTGYKLGSRWDQIGSHDAGGVSSCSRWLSAATPPGRAGIEFDTQPGAGYLFDTRNLAIQGGGVLNIISVIAIVFAGYCVAKEVPKIAFLPSFSDFDGGTPMRAALPAFDARLQAELLKGWNSEVLSRAGLSVVVFEQKLRAVGEPSVPMLRVLPSGFLVFCVLDQPNKQLRVYVNRVSAGMALAEPRMFPIRDAKSIANELPREVAKHVAAVAGLSPNDQAAPSRSGTQKAVVCSLLEPVNTGGANPNLGQVSPLIRAVLESLVASEEVGATLVERSESSKLLEEKAMNSINGLDSNGATHLGRMVKADLILIPFIHFQNPDRIDTDLFAVDVATGRMLACRSWTGGLLDTPPAALVRELLFEAVQTAGESSLSPVPDDRGLRHAEAGFMIGLKQGWNGLRQLVATEAELSIRLGDAALALASDDEAIMRKAAKTFYRDATPAALHPLVFEYNPDDQGISQISALKKSGQLDLLLQQARQVFELPMTELARTNADDDLQLLAELWIRLGDSTKAWSILTRGGQPIQELALKSPYYQTMVVALMNLGRYQECVDLLENRKKWNSLCTTILLDAYRALGNKQREFEIMRLNLKSACKTERTTSRFLDLAIERGEAGPVVGAVVATGNSWMISSPRVRKSMSRARVAAGQKELAISDAQCGLIAAVKAKDVETQKEMRAIISELGASPIVSLPAAREFLVFPKGFRIDLIHDQTVDLKYVSEVAAHVAAFWGCPVHVRSVRVDLTGCSGYQKLSQALELNFFADLLTHVSFPDGSAIGTVFLTQTKLISKKKDYTGDVYCLSRGAILVLSDHYFRKFKDSDARPLPLITAIAAAKLTGVSRMVRSQTKGTGSWEEVFFPPPPDLYSANGNLHLVALDLGVSPATGAMLEKVSPSALMQSIPEINARAKAETAPPAGTDLAIIIEFNQQISEAKPTIINP
ncbi:MAG: hypothetical protein QE267_02215 [Akkermansiaceae bacterium]|nr:hypothetical protein [Akkermansiaceae bacterium]